jgi:hypothetical protein
MYSGEVLPTLGPISITPAISIALRHFSANFWHLKNIVHFFLFYLPDWSISYKKLKEKIEKYFS